MLLADSHFNFRQPQYKLLDMSKINIGLLLTLCLFLISERIQAQEEKKIWVGCEYFNGWWEQSPSKWEHQFNAEGQGRDWRAQYPERIPLLGEFNSQETMDKEIKIGAEHGIDFFSILYYYGSNVTTREIEDVSYLNAGLDYFMNSPNAEMMKFMVELCNHPPFAIITDQDWDKCMDVCIKAMKHTSYLRVDGRAVLKIHGGDQFYLDLDSDINKCSDVINRLRNKAKSEGIELLVTVGAYGDEKIDDSHYFNTIGQIEGTMQYMDPTELPQKETDYPYELLSARAQEMRDARDGDVLPYVPYFPAGWNPRPWGDPRAAFSFPTKKQWKSSLKKLKNDLEKSSNLGFSKKDGTVQKAFTIYAWNEFGEGGIVAPTVSDQYMKLEVIKDVFGSE